MRTVDVLVVGAGPAGCAATIALCRAGYRTLQLDRPSAHAKAGEGLPGSAGPVLAALGLRQVLDASCALPWVGIASTWGSAEAVDRPFVFGAGDGWLLDRRRFDDALVAVAAGLSDVATCEPGTEVALVHDDGWHATWVEDGAECRVDARFAIDASGRSRVVVRQSRPAVTVVDRLVGWHAIVDRSSAVALETTVRAAPRGWWYAAPIPHDRAVVCFFTDAELATRQDVLALVDAPEARATFAAVGASGSLWTPRPHPSGTSYPASAVGSGWLAIGDAALAQDPLAGHGLEFALRSGLRGAGAVAAWLRGDRGPATAYADMVARRAHAFVAARRAIYRSEERWSEAPFWRRRRESVTSVDAA